jgi:hypothetical protein
MDEIYKNRLEILKCAIKLNDYQIIDMILYSSTNIKINNVIKISIEEGYIKYFNKYCEIYKNNIIKKYNTLFLCLSKINIYIPKEIYILIKSYDDKIRYNYVHNYIIDNYEIFIKFMKICYNGYSKIHYYDCGWCTNVKTSVSYYCLVNNMTNQLQYLLNNDLFDITEIKEFHNRLLHIRQNGIVSIIGINDAYKIIKHLL